MTQLTQAQEQLIAEALQPMEGEVVAESIESVYTNEAKFLEEWANNMFKPKLQALGEILTSKGTFSSELVQLLKEVFPAEVLYPCYFVYQTASAPAANHEFTITQHYSVSFQLRTAVLAELGNRITDAKVLEEQSEILRNKWGLFIRDWIYEHETYCAFKFTTPYTRHLRSELDLAIREGLMNEPSEIVLGLVLTTLVEIDLEGHSGSTIGMHRASIRQIVKEARERLISSGQTSISASVLWEIEQEHRPKDAAFRPAFVNLEKRVGNASAPTLTMDDLVLVDKLITCATAFGLLSPLTLDLETEFAESHRTTNDSGQEVIVYQSKRKSDVFQESVGGILNPPYYNNGFSFSYNGGMTLWNNSHSRIKLTGDILNDAAYLTDLPNIKVLVDPIAYAIYTLNTPKVGSEKDDGFLNCLATTAPLKSSNPQHNLYLKQGEKILNKYGHVLTVNNIIYKTDNPSVVVGYDVTNYLGEKFCVLQENWATGVGTFSGISFPLFRPYVGYYTNDNMDAKRDDLHSWVGDIEEHSTPETLVTHNISLVDYLGTARPKGITRLYLNNVLYIVPDNAPIDFTRAGTVLTVKAIKIDFDRTPELLHHWQDLEKWRNLTGNNVLRLGNGAGKTAPQTNGGW